MGGWVLFNCVRAGGIGWNQCLGDCLLFCTYRKVWPQTSSVLVNEFNENEWTERV